tara:strand:- start:134 stop:325 length:192 start_codon:yes stop_codon:yes gene_type:complete
MIAKVLVEVGDMEKLKKAIAAYAPWVDGGTEETGTLVALARRVVAAEEKIQELNNTPVDISSD